MTTTKAVRITTAGGDVTLAGVKEIHGYSIVTDGANNATLKIYNDAAKTDQRWEDQCIGSDLVKERSWAAPLKNPTAGTTVLSPSGTGGVFYVRVSGGT